VVVDAHLYGRCVVLRPAGARETTPAARAAIIRHRSVACGPLDMSLAFVFPARSQSVAMMSALATISPVIAATFAEASEVLGLDSGSFARSPPEALNATECTQPAMASRPAWRTYRLGVNAAAPWPPRWRP